MVNLTPKPYNVGDVTIPEMYYSHIDETLTLIDGLSSQVKYLKIFTTLYTKIKVIGKLLRLMRRSSRNWHALLIQLMALMSLLPKGESNAVHV